MTDNCKAIYQGGRWSAGIGRNLISFRAISDERGSVLSWEDGGVEHGCWTIVSMFGPRWHSWHGANSLNIEAKLEFYAGSVERNKPIYDVEQVFSANAAQSNTQEDFYRQ